MYIWLDCYKGWRSRIDSSLSFMYLFLSPFIIFYYDYKVTSPYKYIFLSIMVISFLAGIVFLYIFINGIFNYVEPITREVPVNYTYALYKCENLHMLLLYYLILTWDCTLFFTSSFKVMNEFDLFTNTISFFNYSLYLTFKHIILSIYSSAYNSFNK